MLQFFLRKKFSTKVYKSFDDIIKDIKSGNKLLLGGFGTCGVPENLIKSLLKKDNLINLEIISDGAGLSDYGAGLLLQTNSVRKLTCSFIGQNKIFEKKFLMGDFEVEMIPQGTLAEKIRCGGAGIPAFYTPTGRDTYVELGGIPIKYKHDGTIDISSQKKEVKEYDGKKYLLEESIRGDFSFIKGWKGDTDGNIIFRKTSRNFNYDVATAGKVCIAEVEYLVEAGELKPDEIHLPGIYVQRIIQGQHYEKRIEKLITSVSDEEQEIRNRIAKITALELIDGSYVNLGIGIPTYVANHLPQNKKIYFHSENGMLGVGPYPDKINEIDSDLINSSKETVTETPGCVYFKSSDSFAMIRGGHLDYSILGALQVSKNGDLASWIIPGKMVKGIGGSMDLTIGAKIIVTMKHTIKGKPKILDVCTLPITGKSVVHKLITELAVFEFPSNMITLTKILEDVSLERIKFETGSNFNISDKLEIVRI